MSAHVGNLKDENGDTFYPITKTNAVLDENNVDIGTRINNLTDYSTDEVAIGKWIDGRTLYRKLFNYTTSDNTSWTNLFDCSSLNIKTVVKIYGSIGDGSNWVNLPVGEGQYYRNFRYNVSSKYIQTINYGFNYNYTGYIAVEYTKNT